MNSFGDFRSDHGWMQRLKGMGLHMRPLFWVTVILPTVISVIYYGFIADPVYVSESRFIVKNASHQSGLNTMLSQMLPGGSGGGAQDGYAVMDYIQSRSIVGQLNAGEALRSYFSKNGDFIAKYHTAWLDSNESLWKYYKRKVIDVKMDDESSIITLKTMAFSSGMAYQINRSVLAAGEQLVNNMNARAEQDAEGLAQQEVDRSVAISQRAAVALAEYRQENSVFDPNRQSALNLQQVSGLEVKLMAVETQLSQLQTISPNNPQLPSLRNIVRTMKQQIASAQAKVAGADASLADKSITYTKLELDSEFAAKRLGMALAALEMARQEVLRKHIYIEEVVAANRPDAAIEPKRIRTVISVILAGLLAWAVLSLLVESVKEHRE